MGLCVLTIEDVVSWVDLAQLRHVFDWMATGRGGANARLTGDANSPQSDTKKSQNKQTKNQLKCRIILPGGSKRESITPMRKCSNLEQKHVYSLVQNMGYIIFRYDV